MISAGAARGRALHAKEDVVILAVSAGFNTVKLLSDCVAETGQGWNTGCVLLFCASQLLTLACIWAQMLVLYKILTLTNLELTQLGFFGPVLSVAAILINAYSFIIHFLDLEALHWKLNYNSGAGYDSFSLFILIIKQFAYPFTFLYSFTAATCWHDVFSRFAHIGAFTLGKRTALDEEPDVKCSIKKIMCNAMKVNSTKLLPTHKQNSVRIASLQKNYSFACVFRFYQHRTSS